MSVKELFECRQRVLFYLDNGLVQEAHDTLEYILAADGFRRLKCWVDEYRHLLVLERLGKYYSMIRLGSGLVNGLSDENDHVSDVVIRMALMRAHQSIGQLETAEKFAKCLLSKLEGVKNNVYCHAGSGAKGFPNGYAPSFDPDLFRETILHFSAKAQKRGGEGSVDKHTAHTAHIENTEHDKHGGRMVHQIGGLVDFDPATNANSTLKLARAKFEEGNFSDCLQVLSR